MLIYKKYDFDNSKAYLKPILTILSIVKITTINRILCISIYKISRRLQEKTNKAMQISIKFTSYTFRYSTLHNNFKYILCIMFLLWKQTIKLNRKMP